MDSGSDHLDAAVLDLLRDTVGQHVAPTARIVTVEPLPIGSGLSGAAVRRYRVVLDGPAGSRTISLVTKNAGLVERRVLTLLQAQRQPNIPFSCTRNLATDAPSLICMQDLGDACRPHSLAPISAQTLELEVRGLASIHVANRARHTALSWPPRTDRAYFTEIIEQQFWRPHWQRALADNEFVRAFRPFIARVETAGESIVDEMAALADQESLCTLVHTDINPSNVLIHEGRPYVIDWEAAHYGPCLLDVPHHFHTLALAERYRAALASSGWVIPAADFAQRYRLCARYTALRYMWWTLDAWREDHGEAPWVEHYISMLLG